MRPPAETSCAARMRRFLTKDCIALKVTANFCVSTTVGASLPILPIDWAKADPPNLRESEEKSI